MLRFTILDSPVGPLVAAAGDDGLALLEVHRPERLTVLHRLFGPAAEGDHPFIATARSELDEYFAGSRRRFDVPLVIRGTPFQEEVWHALVAIPYGETRAYSELAEQLGRPGSQ